MQRNVVAEALAPGRPFWLPVLFRALPRVAVPRDLRARRIAFGVRRERVRPAAGLSSEA